MMNWQLIATFFPLGTCWVRVRIHSEVQDISLLLREREASGKSYNLTEHQSKKNGFGAAMTARIWWEARSCWEERPRERKPNSLPIFPSDSCWFYGEVRQDSCYKAEFLVFYYWKDTHTKSWFSGPNIGKGLSWVHQNISWKTLGMTLQEHGQNRSI